MSPLGAYSETLSARDLKPGYGNQPYKIYEILEPVKVEAGTTRPWFGYNGSVDSFLTFSSYNHT